MSSVVVVWIVLAANPRPVAEAADSALRAPLSAAELEAAPVEDGPPVEGSSWHSIIHKPNPYRTCGMVRYVERGGILYARPYDYRTLFDYPWHHRKPLGPPPVAALYGPPELWLPSGHPPVAHPPEEIAPPAGEPHGYPDVEAPPLAAPREARLRRMIAPLGRPVDHLVR